MHDYCIAFQSCIVNICAFYINAEASLRNKLLCTTLTNEIYELVCYKKVKLKQVSLKKSLKNQNRVMKVTTNKFYLCTCPPSTSVDQQFIKDQVLFKVLFYKQKKDVNS